MARKTRTTKKTPLRNQAIAIVRASAQEALDAGKAALTQVRKTRKMAYAKANEAKQAAIAGAEEAKSRTVEAVSALEKVFEQRVSRAIAKMGVPTTKDVRALSRQVAQLQASVNSLRRSRARASA